MFASISTFFGVKNLIMASFYYLVAILIKQSHETAEITKITAKITYNIYF